MSSKWFCVQQMSENEQRTKHELARSAKRSESLRRILKQYGVSVENPEESKTSSRLDDLDCEEKHDAVTSSVIDDDSKMIIFQDKITKFSPIFLTVCFGSMCLSDAGGVLLTSLLPVLGFCIICIIGTLHTIISRKTSQGHHHGSERWRTALMDWNEPLASDGHDSMSPEYRVASTNQEATATDEMNEAYSRVELEYKRFLLECGVGES
ncbi:putative protein [Arabidopsis thaliana]|uniref:Uncharacterized protein AT4g09970 n=1 Tax=Arabidopsis thaliana TaxID=3702 RepID=Q9T0F5_ARATH|nr:putative protein [Arabidopsis thaliana]CAB78120.1 putative protein [Arabidopsis thaliana]